MRFLPHIPILVLAIALHQLSAFAHVSPALDEVSRAVDQRMVRLEQLYQDLHAHPELSHEEKNTSSRIARELRELGLEVKEKIGGYGLVGILKNGSGPIGMLRAELDALPIQEATGLPYASKASGVMHACGHDVHLAGLVGAAYVLSQLKDRWRGTILFVGQPAEENGPGSEAMLRDGLYQKFPKPDYAIAFHVFSEIPAGEIGYRSGYAMAGTDSIDITLNGKGGHGGFPQKTIDPFIMAAELTLRLQTLISREIDPTERSVISVGSIQGGNRYNVIPDQVKMQATLRSYNDASREFLKKRIEEIAAGISAVSRAPKPTVQFSDGAPPVYNDPDLLTKLKQALAAATPRISEMEPIMGADDFSFYRQGMKIPSLLFFVGAEHPDSKGLISPNHSARFAPDFRLSVKTGITAVSLSVLTMQRKN